MTIVAREEAVWKMEFGELQRCTSAGNGNPYWMEEYMKYKRHKNKMKQRFHIPSYEKLQKNKLQKTEDEIIDTTTTPSSTTSFKNDSKIGTSVESVTKNTSKFSPLTVLFWFTALLVAVTSLISRYNYNNYIPH